MLTRDFTRSRNLSQELAASRSRPAWVAVVIGGEKKPLCYFHRCEKAVESRSIRIFLQASEFLPAPERCTSPLSLRAKPIWKCRPKYRRYETARDCRRLARMGQAKSVRRHSPSFTHHTQFFHKHKNCANCPYIGNFRGLFEKIFGRAANIAQETGK